MVLPLKDLYQRSLPASINGFNNAPLHTHVYTHTHTLTVIAPSGFHSQYVDPPSGARLCARSWGFGERPDFVLRSS